jgi:GH18 family chitinase
MTAYEKLKSLPNAEQYLKEGITFEELDKIAYAFSDNEWAEKMQKVKEKLLENCRK